MKHIRSALSVCLCLLLLLCVSVPFAFAAEPADTRLQFKPDGTFTILHLTDTQDDQYPAKQLKPFLETAIATAKPDLIVFTGDLVEDLRVGDKGTDARPLLDGVAAYGLTGKDKAKTRENALAAADDVLQIFSDSGVPFAMVQGNNDYKVSVSNEDWLAFYSKYTGNLTLDMSAESDGIDYRLPVVGTDGSLKLNLYCMDTVTSEPDPASLDWYKADSSAQKAQNKATVPAFVFQHIPVDEITNLFVPCSKSDPCGVPSVRDGSIGFFRLAEGARGYFDTVYQSDGESDEFAAWKQQSDVVAAFFGHMHQDGYSGVYDGIELNLTYGCEFAKSGPYGMRVITLHEDDVTAYENQVYTYTNGTFTADQDQAAPKTTWQKVQMLFSSLLYLMKTILGKVVQL